jgi:hypothetical protein
MKHWLPMNWPEQEWQKEGEIHSLRLPLDKKSGWTPET